MSSCVKVISVAARSSLLSKAQVQEVFLLLKNYCDQIEFSVSLFQTQGDLDQITPLSSLGKTDFFTKEVDEAISKGICQIGIHSAKDLPGDLPGDLQVIACTKGLDPSDVLVLRDGELLELLPIRSKVGTSCKRREENLRSLRSDLCCVEIRGTIEKRLALLDAKEVDAVIMAKAALIRLGLHRNIVTMPGEAAPMQGRLAIVARKQDKEMQELFAPLHWS